MDDDRGPVAVHGAHSQPLALVEGAPDVVVEGRAVVQIDVVLDQRGVRPVRGRRRLRRSGRLRGRSRRGRRSRRVAVEADVVLEDVAGIALDDDRGPVTVHFRDGQPLALVERAPDIVVERRAVVQIDVVLDQRGVRPVRRSGRGLRIRGLSGAARGIAAADVAAEDVAALSVDDDCGPLAGGAGDGQLGTGIVFTEDRRIQRCAGAETHVHGVYVARVPICSIGAGARTGVRVRIRGGRFLAFHLEVAGGHEAPRAVDRDRVPLGIGAVMHGHLRPLGEAADHLVVHTRAAAQVDVVAGHGCRFRIGVGAEQRKQQDREQQRSKNQLSHLIQILFSLFGELSSVKQFSIWRPVRVPAIRLRRRSRNTDCLSRSS